MAWADVLTTYDAHLVAAGATLSPPITTVLRGEPTSLTTVPVIGYWWGGRRTSEFGGHTLSSANVDEALVTTIYVPDSVRLPNKAESVEDYLYSAVFAIHARLFGDAHLGENVMAIDVNELSSTATGWAVLSNTVARTATFTCWVAMVDVHTIAN